MGCSLAFKIIEVYAQQQAIALCNTIKARSLFSTLLLSSLNNAPHESIARFS
ncbi:hypothetical protein VB735_30495 [Halotia wernerae UHCC 0503]|nr:hypothetical protein [Halotia wernerae UHCC 0503]